jgi:hypothetical protein
MTYLVWGKTLETVGAIFLAYVGIRACVIEILVGQHLHGEVPPGTDLEKLRVGLRTVLERRKAQFGFYEAIAVAVGTLMIAIGCGLYLAGLLMEPH